MKKKEIIDNIKAKTGITQLNAMQREMAETEKRDIILLAPTGSGKTLAFAIRMLRNVDVSTGNVSAIVLAPSRELVLQLAEVIRPIATGLKTVAFYGGHAMSDEVNSLSVTPDIIISTPGRMVDHLRRSTVDVSKAKSVILDEYDKSLELGFLEEIRRIVKTVRKPSLRMLTSATPLSQLPEFMGNSADYTVFDFSEEVIAPKSTTSIFEVESDSKDKLETLMSLLRSLDNKKTIIFVNHRESAERVYERLASQGFPVGIYHGGMEQHQRRMAVDMLANGSTPILVSTDLASRGLDIPEVGYVIHYHMPLSPETWTHRNGRTARQGAEGTIYVILSPGENMPEGETAVGKISEFVPSTNQIRAQNATIYFNAGKKEKISKGDIAGFLIQKGHLTKDEVGIIVVDDHHSIAAVPRDKAQEVITAISTEKLKGKRVKASIVKRL